MENSVLSDAAGVQKNISKMYEDYAKTIGKSTDSLTQSEKAQAVYNGIMDEAAMFTGSAAEMADGYQGVQAQLDATNLELSRTLGESMIPALTQYSSLQLSIAQGLTEFIKNHKVATSGIVTFTTALLATVIAVTGVKKALTAYEKATNTANAVTKAFTASLLSNPLFWGGLAISAGIAALNIFITKMQETIDKNEELAEKSQSLSEALQNTMNEDFTMTQTDKETIENSRDEAEEIVRIYEEKKNRIEEIENEIVKLKEKGGFLEFGLTIEDSENLNKYKTELLQLKEAQSRFEKENLSGGKTIDFYRSRLETLNKTLGLSETKQDYLTKTNIKAKREQLINIAQTKTDIQGKQELLNILKKGETTTEEYANAKSQLVKVYPELARVNENTITSTQAMIDSENAAADAEWALAQSTIINSIAELSAMQANDEKVQQIAIATKQKTDDVRASIEATTNALVQLSQLSPEDFKGSVTSGYTPKIPKTTKSSGSYSNKALDEYKKQLEYKKLLDQLSLQDEISGYEYALRRYAKTQDEKRELTTKIYELKKELQQKELDDYTSFIDYKKSLEQLSTQDEINMYQYAYDNLAKTTEQKRDLEVKLYELRKELKEKEEEDQQAMLDKHLEYIQYKKSLDQLSLEEEISMYQYAYDNLAKTTEQKRDLEINLYELRKQLSEKERKLLNEQTKEIERNMELQKQQRGAAYDVAEETDDLNKIIELHKNYLAQILKDERLSLEERKEVYEDELSVIKSYEDKKRELRVSSINDTVSQLKSAITKQIEEMEKADEDAIQTNIKLVEEWKDTRIEAINSEYEARIEVIQKELDALDKAEEQKSREEEDADYNKKKRRLEELIAFEHDEVTKMNYIKELDKLKEDYQKTVDKRILQDKKEALKEQKDLLKEEQSTKTNQVKEEAEKQKEQYQTQLDDMKEYYEKQKEMAQETAEKMLLNVEQNQEQILSLLNRYGDKYEITGQSLGEKLAQGINNGLADKITGIIQTVQDRIDGAIENQINKWVGSMYKYEKVTSNNQGQTANKTVEINQYNTITTPIDSPSVAYKKQETLNRSLANQIASVF